MGLQADYRAAAVTMLTAVATAASVNMQVYRARPRTLRPPTGFVDSLGDGLEGFVSPSIAQHVPLVEVVTVWGTYDSGEAVDQRDAFVDAFHDYVRVNFHAAGANTLIRTRELVDIPNYIPDWLPEPEQITFYATRIVLEGTATD